MDTKAKPVTDRDFVIIRPVAGRETIIRAEWVHELNGPYEDTPPAAYLRDPQHSPKMRLDKQVVMELTTESYAELRKVLTGIDLPPPDFNPRKLTMTKPETEVIEARPVEEEASK